MANTKSSPPAHLLPATTGTEPAKGLTVEAAQNPLPRGTLGDLRLATEVKGAPEFALTILIQPFEPQGLTGIDPASVRVFRWTEKDGSLRPIWNSGINVGYGFVWAKIRRPGVYVPIGLPRDRVVRELLWVMARLRSYADAHSAEEMRAITNSAVELFLKAPEKEIEELRRFLAIGEIHSAVAPVRPHEIRLGRHGGHLLAFPLPHDEALDKFKERLKNLETPPEGLPEEALFLQPELQQDPTWSGRFPISSPPDPEPVPEPFPRPLPPWPWPFPPVPRPFPWPLPLPWPWFCRFFSQNWWMYHHDERHSGHASGCSSITSCNVGRMTLHRTVAVDGPVITVPTIVQGKVYMGTGNRPGGGGTLYKIDLLSGNVDLHYDTPSGAGYYPGIGGSPAVVAGKVYFTAVPGIVYCLDANTFTELWTTNLRTAHPIRNQPVTNPSADCFSSPLVVNGKVFVGCGEGEGGAFGIVYCLEATSGSVIWLFCTNKFAGAGDNSPNVIPNSAVGISPLPPGFTSQADPPNRGASVWSSCAYDAGLNRIYVGTGNSTGAAAPGTIDTLYGSGVLALDADTGAFHGFFQPSPGDSYRPTDEDIDVCSGPTVFTRAGTRAVAIGSKSGAFFVLDANTLAPLARRQLLPKDAVTGAPLPGFDPGPGENLWGVFGTAAVHYGLGRLYVGIGGYAGGMDSSGIDSPTTPFMRALDWNTLNDAWTTAVQPVGANQVARYIVPQPPMYTTAKEAGLSSPAVVNDVVFVSTSALKLYALDAGTGLCLWIAPGIVAGALSWDSCILGPAIYGNYVVIGASNGNVYIYSL